MPAGDASRTWFSEMVETLRREWRPDTPWEEIIALRDRLDTILQQIRLSRGIRPPTMWCPVCKQRTQQAEPSVSVRAVIFALGRFGILPQVKVKSLEKRWAKHRKENGLDRNGRLTEAVITDSSSERPAAHSHSPTSKKLGDVAPEEEPRQSKPLSTGSTRNVSGPRPR